MRYAFRTRPKKGEQCCGDAVGIFGSEGRRLFAVSDGLGHGPEAHHASAKALACLAQHWDEDLESVMWECHANLKDTRGIALFLARLTENGTRHLECTGVGNVEFRSTSASRMTPFCRDGIVGRNMRKVSVFHYEPAPGDTFAIFSDGIHTRFDIEAAAAKEPDHAAEGILTGWGKDYDDATILVVKA